MFLCYNFIDLWWNLLCRYFICVAIAGDSSLFESSVVHDLDVWTKLLWNCKDDCRYKCMWRTVQGFQERGYKIPKFHGKVSVNGSAGLLGPRQRIPIEQAHIVFFSAAFFDHAMFSIPQHWHATNAIILIWKPHIFLWYGKGQLSLGY